MYQNQLTNPHGTLARITGTLRRGLAILAVAAFAVTAWSWTTSAPAEAGPHALEAAGSASGPASGPAGRPARSADRAPRSATRPVRVAEAAEATEPLVVKGKTLRGKLNLNTATEEQLQTLPGIGASKARRILEYREKNGKFARVRDLRRVKGIGYKTLKKLSPYLTVKGQTTLTLE